MKELGTYFTIAMVIILVIAVAVVMATFWFILKWIIISAFFIGAVWLVFYIRKSIKENDD
jgi:hypothetical protein